MRSPYMSILENIGRHPREYVLPSGLDAGIAATCVRALAKNHGMNNVRALKHGKSVIVWQGPEHRIEFTPPKRAVGKPGRPPNSERLQITALFGEATA